MFTPDQLATLQTLLTMAGWLALVIFLDLALGVTVALKAGQFQWQRLADFLADYGPKCVGWMALEGLGFLPADISQYTGMVFGPLGHGAYALIIISAVASILGHASALDILPGRPLKKAGIPATGDEQKVL